MPTFYASQYETGRPIIIDIMMGEDAFDCSELYIELHARKVDDNIVTLEPDSVDGNQVTFVGTEQLFACPGKNLCELCLYADETKDTSLGSLNFFIEVEPDPMSGGLTSETQIYNLTQQIEEIAQEVIGEDYYDKTEVDDLLDLKADKATTYTKTEVDNALNLKADKSDTYTKTQTDNLLNDKADKATTYTKTQVDNALALKANSADLATVATTGDYDDLTNKPTIPAAQVQSDYAQADNTKVDYIKNKPDLSIYATNDNVASLIYDLLPVGSASGAVANFTTEIGNVNLVDCKASIVASQASGTPTPSSPLAISGYTGVNINFVDFNQLASTTGITSPQTFADVTFTKGDNGSWSASGTASGRIQTTNLFDRFYTITGHKYAVIINKDITPFVFRENNGSLGQTTQSKIFACPDGKNAYITLDSRIDITGTVVNLQNVIINIFDLTQMFGSTIADYIYTLETQTAGAGVSKFKEIFYKDYYAYNAGGTKVSVASVNNDDYPYASVSWQDEAGTVYGGNLDLTTGVLTVTHGEIDSYNGESINEPWLSSKDVYTEGGTPTTGAQVVYPLTMPITYQLTPVQVQALLGVNNVFNDTNGDTEVQYKDSIQHYIDTRV